MIERLRLIFRLVVYWSLATVIFLAGTFHGRRLERVCWENALQEVSQEYEQLLLLEKIIRLESGGKHENVWGADGERGILQFKKSTFEWMANLSGMKDLRWERQIDQIRLCNWAIRNGYASKHWSTYPEGN
jgi:hypothetical protein